MRYRPFGNTSLNVSEIGFGAWAIGGDSYGPVDDNESLKALQFAYDRGINFFDTADSYGGGHSETLIGKALKKVRDKIFIATKGGCLPHSGRAMPQNFSVKHIEQSLENSLKRLRTDYIDVYQLHSPPIEILEQDELLETLLGFKQSGKVRALGISVRSPGDGLKSISRAGFDCIQINFNLLDHRALEIDLFKTAAEKKIGLIGRTPLCFGFLTGKYSEHSQFTEGDHRSHWPAEQIRRWAQSASRFESLYTARKITPAQFALTFCLSYPAVSTVIPGMKTMRHVEENVRAGNLDSLTKKDLETIRKIYKNHEVFASPSKK